MKNTFFGICVSICIATPLAAQDARLDLLREMMDAVCGDYQYTGTTQKVRIDGAAEAKIGGIMGKLVDVGVKGAAGFNEQEYVGVLREEAGSQLIDVRKCRTKVFDDMKILVVSAPVEKIEIVEDAVARKVELPKSAIQPQTFLSETPQEQPTIKPELSLPAEKPNPSYDCLKAGTPTEYTLCGDVYLASLDRRIAELYFGLRKKLGGQSRKNLLTSQRKFLKTRNQCGASVPCLTAIHEQRIVELSD